MRKKNLFAQQQQQRQMIFVIETTRTNVDTKYEDRPSMFGHVRNVKILFFIK